MDQYKEYGYTTLTPNYAHQYLVPVLLKLLDPDKNRCILDVGCGNGSLGAVLHQQGYNVYGIDASSQGIALANQVLPGRFFVQNISSGMLPEELQQKDFDTIISTEVIEHLYDPRAFIEFCKSVLSKSRGSKQLILSTPYHGYWKNLALAITGALDAHFTVLWDGGHIKFWSRKTLGALLQEKEFKVTAFRGAGRLPYLWKSMVIRGELSV